MDYAEVVPEPDQHRLIQWGEDIDSKQWMIAHYAVQRCKELEKTHDKIQVCKSIAYWCRQSPNTVRDWERIARNVPRDVVEEFPTLSMSHFRLLIPHCNTAKEYVEKIDEWMNDKKTLTHSVASLAAFLDPDGEYTWYDRMISARHALEKITKDETASPRVRLAARRFLFRTQGEVKD